MSNSTKIHQILKAQSERTSALREQIESLGVTRKSVTPSTGSKTAKICAALAQAIDSGDAAESLKLLQQVSLYVESLTDQYDESAVEKSIMKLQKKAAGIERFGVVDLYRPGRER